MPLSTFGPISAFLLMLLPLVSFSVAADGRRGSDPQVYANLAIYVVHGDECLLACCCAR